VIPAVFIPRECSRIEREQAGNQRVALLGRSELDRLLQGLRAGERAESALSYISGLTWPGFGSLSQM
jgi:hypothetical protein